MISDQVLTKVGEMLWAEDSEMRNLGKEIFLQSDPTGEDVERLYELRGGQWRTELYIQALINNILRSDDFNI